MDSRLRENDENWFYRCTSIGPEKLPVAGQVTAIEPKPQSLVTPAMKRYVVSSRDCGHKAAMRSSAARSWLHEGRLDRIGILLSGLCAVHCVTTIGVMALLASVGGTLLHPAIHEIGLVLAVLLGVVALGAGYLRHGQRLPTAIGGIGLATMAMALTLPHGVPEAIATLSGVALLAYGHYLNRRAGC